MLLGSVGGGARGKALAATLDDPGLWSAAAAPAPMLGGEGAVVAAAYA